MGFLLITKTSTTQVRSVEPRLSTIVFLIRLFRANFARSAARRSLSVLVQAFAHGGAIGIAQGAGRTIGESSKKLRSSFRRMATPRKTAPRLIRRKDKQLNADEDLRDFEILTDLVGKGSYSYCCSS